MAVVPDYLGGVMARIKAHPATVAKIGPRVSTVKGQAWAVNTFAIQISRSGGPPIEIETNRMQALVALLLFGPTEYEAYQLWAGLHDWVCPDGQSAPNFYRPGPTGLLFETVQHFSGPLALREAVTDWPYLVVRYLFRFPVVPV